MLVAPYTPSPPKNLADSIRGQHSILTCTIFLIRVCLCIQLSSGPADDEPLSIFTSTLSDRLSSPAALKGLRRNARLKSPLETATSCLSSISDKFVFFPHSPPDNKRRYSSCFWHYNWLRVWRQNTHTHTQKGDHMQHQRWQCISPLASEWIP